MRLDLNGNQALNLLGFLVDHYTRMKYDGCHGEAQRCPHNGVSQVGVDLSDPSITILLCALLPKICELDHSSEGTCAVSDTSARDNQVARADYGGLRKQEFFCAGDRGVCVHSDTGLACVTTKVVCTAFLYRRFLSRGTIERRAIILSYDWARCPCIINGVTFDNTRGTAKGS